MAFKFVIALVFAINFAYQVHAEIQWNLLDSIERTGHGDLFLHDIRCVEDMDCCDYCACQVIDPIHKRSECVHMGLAHLNQFEEDDDLAENTERGEFEVGYWCLKNTDCATKRCAQVGPRKYDKECQTKDYEEFVVPAKKAKKRHVRREDPPKEDKNIDLMELKEELVKEQINSFRNSLTYGYLQ